MILADNEHSGLRRDFPDSAGGLDSVEIGEANVEHDQVRRQLPGLLNGIKPVGYRANYMQLRLRLKGRADEPAPWFVIVDNKNAY
jgi:hypothetical protein